MRARIASTRQIRISCIDFIVEDLSSFRRYGLGTRYYAHLNKLFDHRKDAFIGIYKAKEAELLRFGSTGNNISANCSHKILPLVKLTSTNSNTVDASRSLPAQIPNQHQSIQSFSNCVGG